MAALDSGEEPLLVRGISIISTREYLKTRLEGRGWVSFLAQLPADVRENTVNSYKSEWYPFRIQRVLREEIVRLFNPEHPRQAILNAYLFATRYEISAFLRGILSFMPVKLVIERAAALWRKYYNKGTMKAISLGKNGAALELTDFPGDRLFCPTVQAWLVNAAGYLRLKDVEGKETTCVHRGDEVCRWEVIWG
ncbi:hypothetical protein GF359_10565 [candidate division WOR-3 bacterium]|uniref:4-vinyl reductase 4VR domain-containing protein n=1 Tax=candidate division WOR-3 bacterium TaxID=2052148 RepID=A0A9D5KCF3_UNCW3|nr:hypothetical protein [candidate division WOR-3 bacterium]MBD3365644.1 hypothetical protein [candidate division WOR-3 bacterium]